MLLRFVHSTSRSKIRLRHHAGMQNEAAYRFLMSALRFCGLGPRSKSFAFQLCFLHLAESARRILRSTLCEAARLGRPLNRDRTTPNCRPSHSTPNHLESHIVHTESPQNGMSSSDPKRSRTSEELARAGDAQLQDTGISAELGCETT